MRTIMKLKNLLLHLIAGIMLLVSSYQSAAQNEGKEIIWHVKAYKPEAELFKVKAFDENGNMYDIKAIQNTDQTSVLDVKAHVNGAWLPVKMLVKNGETYYPIKAIAADGTILNIKAVTDDGTILPIKGVKTFGNIIDVCAIFGDTIFYNILAFSPEGNTNVLKGLKMTQEEIETKVQGVEVYAHIKAITQTKY